MTEQEQLAHDVYLYNHGDLTVDQRAQLTAKFKAYMQIIMSHNTGINTFPSHMRPVYNQVKLALWSGFAKKRDEERQARLEAKRTRRAQAKAGDK